jgi:hypothetical protein
LICEQPNFANGHLANISTHAMQPAVINSNLDTATVTANEQSKLHTSTAYRDVRKRRKLVDGFGCVFLRGGEQKLKDKGSAYGKEWKEK